MYIEFLEAGAKQIEEMKSSCESLIVTFQEKIQGAKQLVELYKQETWHTRLCQDLEDYIGNRITSREAREAFKQHLKSINLEPKLQSRFLSAFSQDPVI